MTPGPIDFNPAGKAAMKVDLAGGAKISQYQKAQNSPSIFTGAPRNAVASDNGSYGANVEDPNDPVTQFKKLDRDGDLKVSAQEYTDNIVEDYVSNGHQLPSEYNNIAEFIDAKYAEFKKFAGKDVSMNIDEFRSMLEARLSTIDSKKEASKSDNVENANPDTAEYSGDTTVKYSGIVEYSGEIPYSE